MIRVLYCLLLAIITTRATERPILGILAQESRVSHESFGTSYIPAAYVKAVEASGARVVPIFINNTQEYYVNILRKVNAVVLPGGSVDFLNANGYAAAGKIIHDTAVKMNDNGNYIPILGVCQGYQLLMFLANHGDTSILTKCESFDALTLDFKDGFRNSSLFKDAPGEIITILQTLPVTSNHHRCLVAAGLLDWLCTLASLCGIVTSAITFNYLT